MRKREVRSVPWFVRNHTISKFEKQVSTWGSADTHLWILSAQLLPFPSSPFFTLWMVQPALPTTPEIQFSIHNSDSFRDRVWKQYQPRASFPQPLTFISGNVSSVILTIKIPLWICRGLLLPTYTDPIQALRSLVLSTPELLFLLEYPGLEHAFSTWRRSRLKCLLFHGAFPDYPESPCSRGTYFWFGSYLTMLSIVVSCEHVWLPHYNASSWIIETMTYSFLRGAV